MATYIWAARGRMSYYRAIRSRAPQPIAVAAAVALIAGPGCMSPSPSEADAGASDSTRATREPPRASRLIGQPAPAEPARALELIDPGREPRRRLRYTAGPGARQRVHLKTSLAHETHLAGRRVTSIPPQLSEAWFVVSAVAAQADRIECEIRFERAVTVDWEVLAADRVGSARTLARLPGHAFRFTVDRRGFVHLPPLRLPPALDVDSDRDLVRDILQRSVRTIVALPDEPIGAGARWRIVEEDHGQFNMAARVSTDLELVAMRGQRVDLKVARAYSIPPQNTFVDIQLLGFSRAQSESSGRAVVDLSLLHPIEARSRMALGVEGAVLVLAEEVPMRTVLTEAVSITAR